MFKKITRIDVGKVRRSTVLEKDPDATVVETELYLPKYEIQISNLEKFFIKYKLIGIARQIISLHFEGLSNSEIAETLQISKDEAKITIDSFYHDIKEKNEWRLKNAVAKNRERKGKL